jgi:glycine dehydrogenase subunit 2
MHEALFDDEFLKDSGVSTLDFAKAMIDEGYHPMTMYFPLVVHGAMLIEPTESQAKEDLDQFIAALRSLAERAKSGTAAAGLQGRPALRAAPPPRRDAGGPQADPALAAVEYVQAGRGVEAVATRRSGCALTPIGRLPAPNGPCCAPARLSP